LQAHPKATDRPSLRPEMTRAITRATGLDEPQLVAVVHSFYAKVRRDPILGPIFETRIADWDAHLARMVTFWSSVALMTGHYHGSALTAHLGLPVQWGDFERWLDLFRETAEEICSPEGARHLIERAERIALSLNTAVQQAKPDDAATFSASA